MKTESEIAAWWKVVREQSQFWAAIALYNAKAKGKGYYHEPSIPKTI